jgi:hypothetical protein
MDSDKKVSADADGVEFDPEKDFNVAGMRKLIAHLLKKAGKPADDEQAEKDDEEREALSDLHEEHKGSPAKIPTTKEDLPYEEDDEEEDEEPPKNKKKGRK